MPDSAVAVLDGLASRAVSSGATRDQWVEVARKASGIYAAAALLATGAGHASGAVATGVDQAVVALIDHVPADVMEAAMRYCPSLADKSRLSQIRFLHGCAGKAGFVNALKGTLFEERVAKAAAAHHSTIAFPGRGFELASRCQKGYDATVHGPRGVPVRLQLKATRGLGPIQHHLRRFPDIPHVVATKEAAQAASAHHIPNVIDSHISNAHLEQHVNHGLQGGGIHEWVPEVALALITAGWFERQHRQGRRAANIWAREQLVTACGANTAAQLVALIPGGALFRIPVAVTTRATITHVQAAGHLLDTVLASQATLSRLAVTNHCPVADAGSTESQ